MFFSHLHLVSETVFLQSAQAVVHLCDIVSWLLNVSAGWGQTHFSKSPPLYAFKLFQAHQQERTLHSLPSLLRHWAGDSYLATITTAGVSAFRNEQSSPPTIKHQRVDQDQAFHKKTMKPNRSIQALSFCAFYMQSRIWLPTDHIWLPASGCNQTSFNWGSAFSTALGFGSMQNSESKFFNEISMIWTLF